MKVFKLAIWFFFALAVLTGKYIADQESIDVDSMLCGFDILMLLLTAKQATFASAAPNYEESVGEDVDVEKRSGDVETGGGSEASDGDVEDEEPLPDEEDGEDLTDGENDVSSEVQKRDLADLLSNLDERDIEDSEVIDMADVEGEEVRAIVKRSNPIVSTKLVLGIAQNKLSGTVRDCSRIGYRPHFFDAYTVGTTTYFNVIFRRKIRGEFWRWYYGLRSSTYQQRFDSNVGLGYRLKNVEAYINSAGNIRYCAIFTRSRGSAPAFYAYHGKTTTYHSSKSTELSGKGYHMVNQVLVQRNGQIYVAALYEKSSVGSWWYYTNLTPAQFKARVSYQRSVKRRELCHVSVYRRSGSIRYSAIFYRNGPSLYNYWYGVSATTIQTKHALHTSNGYNIQLISGYPGTNPHRFVGFWAK